MQVFNPSEAREMLRHGTWPTHAWTVKGLLDASELPMSMLPETCHTRRIDLSNCTQLQALPDQLHCYELILRNTCMPAIPAGLQVDFRLDLTGNQALTTLPADFKTGSLILAGCTNLIQLPEGLAATELDLSNCVSFRRWPQAINLAGGSLNLTNCVQLTYLPANFGPLARLDLRGCQSLFYLPDDLEVHASIDIADTGISELPVGCQNAQLRWRGVPITQQIAFQPATLTVEQVFAEPNTEIRRVMIERIGYDRFLEQAQPRVLDTDQDPGGERRLVMVDLQEDEPLVCLLVSCPSTGRRYSLRVPPFMRSCHQAAAWLAGFVDPSLYQPLLET